MRKQTVHAIVDKDGKIVFNAVTVSPSMKCMSCHDAWTKFFREHAHQYPLGDAIRAYEAIGYRCAKFELTEVPLDERKEYDDGDEYDE
jgi:hypothetical protein